MMLSVSELMVAYPDKTIAVNNFNIQINDGESAALAGANGAGKTTLMLAVAGVLPLEKGKIEVDGISLEKKTLDQVRRRVGLVFQNPDDQLFMASIYDDVAFGPRSYGLPEETVNELTDQALADMGISHLRGRSSLKLSGGEKRLAAIATVLSMRPSILLFDEPTAFLDLKARRNLIRLLKSIPQAKLIASHDLTFLEEVCGRAVLMKDGTVFADGKITELFTNKKLMEDCDLEAL